jgi:light-regulated signal transduction histidine kinase (bacteriophytochrome)
MGLSVSALLTERRRAEEELRRLADELTRSNQDLEQFASIASHDLKEPLRTVSCHVGLLRTLTKGKLDARAQESLKFALDATKRMTSLIDNLLSYSRIGKQPVCSESLDLQEVLAQAVSNLKIAIEESGASVASEPLPTISGDRDQLVQLFQNLIGNSIKYHRRGEPPEVRISCAREMQHWLFDVRDNGIGMEMKHAEAIFKVFQRLHSKSEYPGHGIGLAICKKIVERCGGRIWVNSTPGVGSVFHFTLRKL